ncbi:MAG: hypothetical protein ACAI35_23585 [Candidatus Methylacidiphilales bacterium]|nr:hypothetical protein [Candidatus Methylacidiphilales bacterium]
MAELYLWIDGAQAGPYTEDELRSRDQSGEMADESILITTDLGQSWAPVAEFRERWAGMPPVAPSARPPAALPSAVRTGGTKRDNYPPGYAPTMKFDIPDKAAPGGGTARPASTIRKSPAARPASVSQNAPPVSELAQAAPGSVPSPASNPTSFVPAARPGADKGVVQPSFARDRDIHIGAASTIRIDIPESGAKPSGNKPASLGGNRPPATQQRPASQSMPASLAAASSLPPAPAQRPGNRAQPPASLMSNAPAASTNGPAPAAGAGNIAPERKPAMRPASLQPGGSATLAPAPSGLAGGAKADVPSSLSSSSSSAANPDATDSNAAAPGAGNTPARPGSTLGKKGISASMNAAVASSASNLAAMVKAAEAASDAAAAGGNINAKPIEVDDDPYIKEDLASQIGMLGGVLLLAGTFCPLVQFNASESTHLLSYKEGYATIALGIAAIFLAWDRRFIGLWGTSIATFGVLAYTYFVSVPAAAVTQGATAPSWTWGIGVMILGALLQIVAAVLSIKKAPKKPL